MNQEYFQKHYKEIIQTLKFAYDNPHTNFYREKYGPNFDIKNIKTYHDFITKVPILKKSELINVHHSELSHVKNIDYYSFSSGTTQKPLVLPFYNNDIYTKQKFNQDEMQQLGVKKCLVLLPPMAAATQSILSMRNKTITIIPGDITNLNMTAQLASNIGFEALITTPTIAEYFSLELKNIEYNINSIKWVSLGNENLTETRYRNLKDIYQGALIRRNYGSSEASQIGSPCYLKDDLDPSSFHAVNTNFLEKSDKDALLLTSLCTPTAFPLIRYDSEDEVILEYKKCPNCPSEVNIYLRGRISRDAIKISGFKLSNIFINKALEKIGINNYKTIYKEKVVGGITKPLVEIVYYSELNCPDLDIKNTLKNNLQLSAKKNLGELINSGVVLDPIITRSKSKIKENEIGKIFIKEF